MIYEARNRNNIFLYEREANNLFKAFVSAVFDEFDGLAIQLEFAYICFKHSSGLYTEIRGQK